MMDVSRVANAVIDFLLSADLTPPDNVTHLSAAHDVVMSIESTDADTEFVMKSRNLSESSPA